MLFPFILHVPCPLDSTLPQSGGLEVVTLEGSAVVTPEEGFSLEYKADGSPVTVLCVCVCEDELCTI